VSDVGHVDIVRHDVKAPKVVYRRDPTLGRYATILHERVGGWVAGSKRRGRRALVGALVRSSELGYREARKLVKNLEQRGWLRYEKRRGRKGYAITA